MTLYVFPDPRADTQARIAANTAKWPGATWSNKHPGTLATGQKHIQYAWDGTPSQQVNRERCAIRITFWTAKGKASDAADGASLVQAVLLDSGSANVWRYTPGPGRLLDTDAATGNEFCTFTLTAETRPTAVA